MQLAQRRRHERHREEQEQPWRVGGESRRQRHHRHGVLGLAEDEAQDGGPAGDLAAGTVEPILLIGGLELLEIEGRGVAHQGEARRVGVSLAEHVPDEPARPTQQIGQDAEAGLSGDQQRDGSEAAASQPVAQTRAGMG